MQRVIISICGGAGSGKSTLARALVEVIGPAWAERVPADYFLQPKGGAPWDDFLARPLAYDWPAVESTLLGPDGEKVYTPNFDFEAFVRLPHGSGRAFYLRPVMVVDGILPYPLASCTVYLAAQPLVRKQRIIARDTLWGTRVIHRWKQLELTDQFRQNLDICYDLILNGAGTIGENIDQLLTTLDLRGWLPDRWKQTAA